MYFSETQEVYTAFPIWNFDLNINENTRFKVSYKVSDTWRATDILFMGTKGGEVQMTVRKPV